MCWRYIIYGNNIVKESIENKVRACNGWNANFHNNGKFIVPWSGIFYNFQIFANIYTLWRIMMWFDGILEGKERYNIYPGELYISYYKCCFPRITILNSISWEERERRERVTKNWLNELFSISSKTNNSTMIFKQPNIFISSVSPLSSSVIQI